MDVRLAAECDQELWAQFNFFSPNCSQFCLWSIGDQMISSPSKLSIFNCLKICPGACLGECQLESSKVIFSRMSEAKPFIIIHYDL
jgi:hypothetical protein